MDGGLHPMYLQLHGLGSASEQELKENKRLLEVSQSDLFDAEGGKDLMKHIVLLVQSFGANIALPHLHHFEAHCAVKGVRPPSVPVPGNELMVDGSSYLPPPIMKGTYAQDIMIHSLPLSQPLHSSFNPLSSGLRPVKFQPKTAISKSTKVTNDDDDIDNDPGWLKEGVIEVSKYDTPLPVIKASSASPTLLAVMFAYVRLFLF
ncbi:hypothetical protein L208DRAFT_1377362 [Tricholoma matsutake]|nr:hypothetical protein L208DRAFT_1377362 [Tricholoma matsutake 945]